MPLLQLRCHGVQCNCECVSQLSYTGSDPAFIPILATFFLICIRCERLKFFGKKGLPQPGIKPAACRSRVKKIYELFWHSENRENMLITRVFSFPHNIVRS